MALRTTVLPAIADHIDDISAVADLDEEPDSHFKKLLGLLDHIEAIGVDADGIVLIGDARDRVQRSIETLEERTRERNDDDTDWSHIVTQEKEETPASPAGKTKRSVFDDVDR